MKKLRQQKILELISVHDIETQNQLIDALHEAGINSTQATVSRDIRELRLVKELTADGKYKYSMPSASGVSDYGDKLIKIFRESVKSFACAQNIVVIKTYPGLANAACAAIDSMDIRYLVGSLAGDDTIFLAMVDNAAAEAFRKDIESML